MLFILNSVQEIMEQYRHLTQYNYIPIPEPVTITSSLQSALFFHYYKDYNAEGVGVRFWNTTSQHLYTKMLFQIWRIFRNRFEIQRDGENFSKLDFFGHLRQLISLTYPSLAVNLDNTCKSYLFGHYSVLSLPVSCSIVRFSMS